MRMWFAEGPTHYKEQIERLQIAVIDSQKKPEAPNPRNFGHFSQRTRKILNALEESDEPMTPDQVAAACGITREQAMGALSDFANNPARYGVKIVGMKGRSRLYTVI